MKWIDIINDLEFDSWANIDDFAYILGIDSYSYFEEWENRVKKYFVRGANWICTDTRVGLSVYKFDNDVIAVSSQSGRKNHEHIYFISIEAAAKIKGFILHLQNNKEYPIINLNDGIDPCWYNQDV